ncbi:MAG: hypothetical protein KF778_19855 [Rhodocyclaceae bacterium]|nr:hypothetical protein [Rhodocyclaceae bacterium]MBX3670663.1 hypothetical protein [Rhodocyclaceae bacterium]
MFNPGLQAFIAHQRDGVFTPSRTFRQALNEEAHIGEQCLTPALADRTATGVAPVAHLGFSAC